MFPSIDAQVCFETKSYRLRESCTSYAPGMRRMRDEGSAQACLPSAACPAPPTSMAHPVVESSDAACQNTVKSYRSLEPKLPSPRLTQKAAISMAETQQCAYSNIVAPNRTGCDTFESAMSFRQPKPMTTKYILQLPDQQLAVCS